MKALKFFIVVLFILIQTSCTQQTHIPTWAKQSEWYGAYTPDIALRPEVEVTIKGETLIKHNYTYYSSIDDYDTTFVYKIYFIKDKNQFVALPLDVEYIDTLSYYKYHYSFINIKGELALRLKYDGLSLDGPYYLFPKNEVKNIDAGSSYIQTSYKDYTVGGKMKNWLHFERHHYTTHASFYEYNEGGKAKREAKYYSYDDPTGLTGLKLTVINKNIIYEIEQNQLAEHEAEDLIRALNIKFDTPDNKPLMDSIVYGSVFPTDYYKKCEWNDGNVKIWEDLIGKESAGFFAYNLLIKDDPVRWLISTKTERKINNESVPLK
jgi:hypothetical protein